MTIASNLAGRITAEWAQSGYETRELPRIAARHLGGDLEFGLSDVISAISGPVDLPTQRRADQSFGQPGVTLHSDERLEIEVLFWHTATPAIHEHGFAGAFRLLAGRSVQCTYDFQPEDTCDGVTTGRLTRRSLDVLHPGPAFEIPAGSEFIHSVFHVDNPSVSLVVRAQQSNASELTYLPPGVAYDTRVRSHSQHKRLQLLDLLATTSHAAYSATVDTMLANGSLYDGLACLLRLGGHDADPSVYDAAENRLRNRFDRFDGIETVFAGAQAERRRCRLVAHREVMRMPDSRIFLALLLGCDCAEEMISAAKAHTGNHSSALDLISTAAARLVSADEMQRVIVKAAVMTRLEGGDTEDFVCAIRPLAADQISEQKITQLKQFEKAILTQPLLAPLFTYRSGQP